MAEMLPLKDRIRLEQVPMKEQSPDVRIHNFKEVPLGYTREEAIREAQRCLQCKNPTCMRGCPAEINIPLFIKYIVEEDFKNAYFTILNTDALPAVTGRVCPQEEQCQRECVLNHQGKPIAIGRLERFVADWARENHVHAEHPNNMNNKKNLKVAVVGSGPAGLTCSADLAKMGYDVTLFEALHKPGGVLVYGIPEFRLPKEIVEYEVKEIEQMGVHVICNYVVGATEGVDDLKKDFDAIFLANGAGAPRFMNIPGENMNDVYSANEFLTRSNLMKAYRFPEYDTPINIGKIAATIGAGNVAMDSARTALRLGAEKSYIIYRRSRTEIPARLEEVHHAEEEGVIFHFLTLPIQILGDKDGKVTGMECIKMSLGEPDQSGRRSPVPIEGSNFVLEIDMVIDAIGTMANPIVARSAQDVEVNRWGYFKVDETTKMTTDEGIFAGGDIIRGSATVISAVGDGKSAARAIHAYLSSGNSLRKK
ncbi:MAG: NADPH-dependent glutamate synthase [Candidatus Atribacteria bacterium]|nr:NADPH-dependent glutamate synthase [Candidatus Atribacteria bacterium]